MGVFECKVCKKACQNYTKDGKERATKTKNGYLICPKCIKNCKACAVAE